MPIGLDVERATRLAQPAPQGTNDVTDWLPPVLNDRRLGDLEFVAFDVETTGSAADVSRVVEIGAVRFRADGTELGRYQQLVNPLRPIPPGVIAIHGITDAMVRDAPAEGEVLPAFVEFLGDPADTVLMAHNARFDLAFLAPAIERRRLPAPPHAVVDTVGLSRRRARHLPSHALRSLVRVFGLGQTTAHRGLADSLDLAGVFLRLIALPPSLTTAADLFRHAPPYMFRSAPAERSRSFGYRRAPRPAFPRPADAPAATACGEELAAAAAAGRIVSVMYDGGRKAGSWRSVTPLRLFIDAEVTYLLAFCHTERKQKQYRLDRIRAVSVEVTTEEGR